MYSFYDLFSIDDSFHENTYALYLAYIYELSPFDSMILNKFHELMKL